MQTTKSYPTELNPAVAARFQDHLFGLFRNIECIPNQ
jgi:hypothetical protein